MVQTHPVSITSKNVVFPDDIGSVTNASDCFRQDYGNNDLLGHGDNDGADDDDDGGDDDADIEIEMYLEEQAEENKINDMAAAAAASCHECTHEPSQIYRKDLKQ